MFGNEVGLGGGFGCLATLLKLNGLPSHFFSEEILSEVCADSPKQSGTLGQAALNTDDSQCCVKL